VKLKAPALETQPHLPSWYWRNRFQSVKGLIAWPRVGIHLVLAGRNRPKLVGVATRRPVLTGANAREDANGTQRYLVGMVLVRHASQRVRRNPIEALGQSQGIKRIRDIVLYARVEIDSR